VDQGKGSARYLQLAGLTCHWLSISGFSPTPLVRLMLFNASGAFGVSVLASSGWAGRRHPWSNGVTALPRSDPSPSSGLKV